MAVLDLRQPPLAQTGSPSARQKVLEYVAWAVVPWASLSLGPAVAEGVMVEPEAQRRPVITGRGIRDHDPWNG